MSGLRHLKGLVDHFESDVLQDTINLKRIHHLLKLHIVEHIVNRLLQQYPNLLLMLS